MNMIWQYWILSFCRRHRAKELLHMLSAMSSTKCSAMIWLRKRMSTPIQTTRKHGNSMKNLGSSVSQDRRFSRRDQRIWRSLGIRSKVPAQQNQHEGIHLWLDVWVPACAGTTGTERRRCHDQRQ